MALRWTMLFGMIMLATLALAQDAKAPKSEKEKTSYALGFDLGNQLRKASVDVDSDVFSQGLKDALVGSQARMTPAEVQAVISKLQGEQKRKQPTASAESDDNKVELALLAAYNKKTGESFLAANAKKEGVITLPSGLQYKIITKGDGKKPTLNDTVVCHNIGKMVDGKEFFNSNTRKEPVTWAVKGVIKGLAEALQLMPAGSKWQLFVPSQLAYGEIGLGPIGPNSTLIYEVELLAIK
jgi:FKBP-type peptidyl-prolyl cis-trans isomerase